jgi:hypothetical protein
MNEPHDLIARVEALEARNQLLRQQVEELQNATVQSTQGPAIGPRSTRESASPPAGGIQPASSGKGRTLSPRRRRGSKDATASPDRANAGSPIAQHVSRITGVRVAHVGARPGSIEGVRRYWEERGAMLMLHPDLADTSFAALSRLFGPADVLFVCAGCLGEEAALRLKAYCDYAQKPLVPLHNAGLSGLRRALRNWSPLA